MNTEGLPAHSQGEKNRTSTVRIVLIVVVVSVVASVITAWLFTTYLFPEKFEPVRLSDVEEQELNAKLERLGTHVDQVRPEPAKNRNKSGPLERSAPTSLTPERYDEADADREISFSEREINALLARNTDLADKLAIDLSHDQISGKLLVPLEPDLPILGGKTLRVTAGLGLLYNAGHPVVMLKGVSLWGIPIPNAWLGGLKNVDLVERFGSQSGFWKAFAAGVVDMRVEEGRLFIRLSE